MTGPSDELPRPILRACAFVTALCVLLMASTPAFPLDTTSVLGNIVISVVSAWGGWRFACWLYP